jgi:hypothetical protein
MKHLRIRSRLRLVSICAFSPASGDAEDWRLEVMMCAAKGKAASEDPWRLMPDSTPPGESKEDRKKRLDRNRRRTHVLDDDAAKAAEAEQAQQEHLAYVQHVSFTT